MEQQQHLQLAGKGVVSYRTLVPFPLIKDAHCCSQGSFVGRIVITCMA